MKLRDYIKSLENFASKHPGSLDLQVVTSSDDEGNNFNPVICGPSNGLLEGNDFSTNTTRFNAVCVN